VASSDNSNKRHRKPNALDPTAQKRAEQEQEEQLEQQVEAEQEQEQQRDTQQDQLGNQGVAAMLGIPSVKPGSAGLGISIGDRDEELIGDLDYGGDDDDVPVDGPLTLRDLTRQWNKGTKRGRDITAFTEPMPAEDLPPEDDALADAIRRAPAPDLPATEALDPLLQPNPAVVAGDMGPWIREALRWSGRGLVPRTVGRMVGPAAPALLDPHGRVLFARARVGALCSLLVLDGPVLREAPTPAVTAFVDLCLELAGQRPTIHAVWWRAQQAQLKLPVGAEIARRELAGRRTGRGRRAELPETVGHHLGVVLRDLIDLPSAKTLVPHVPEVPVYEADEDDPLGLDDVLAEHTGGRPDPLVSIYATTIHGAERLASAVARTRVRLAGLAVALSDVGDQWIAGAPVDPVVALVEHSDRESQRILTLLVEIAQAARRRAVAPAGIRNGLRRAAKMLDKLVTSTIRSMARLAGGLIPEVPDLPALYEPEPEDPLTGAWADGRPQDALPWLATVAHGVDREAAELFTRAGAGEPPYQLADPLLALADRCREDRPWLGEAARVVAGSCLMWAQRYDEALEVGSHHLMLGRSRRNGLLMASGALLCAEVFHQLGEPADRDDVRRIAGIDAWHMGQRAALTLLLRWEPPQVEVDELIESAFR